MMPRTLLILLSLGDAKVAADDDGGRVLFSFENADAANTQQSDAKSDNCLPQNSIKFLLDSVIARRTCAQTAQDSLPSPWPLVGEWKKGPPIHRWSLWFGVVYSGFQEK
jgi:hypothetical protein